MKPQDQYFRKQYLITSFEMTKVFGNFNGYPQSLNESFVGLLMQKYNFLKQLYKKEAKRLLYGVNLKSNKRTSTQKQLEAFG